MKTKKNNKVILLQRIIPHYRIDTFNKLLSFIDDFKIFYGQPSKNEMLKNCKIPNNDKYKFYKNFYIFNNNIFISNIFKQIIKEKPKCIITVFNVGNLNIIILFLLRIFMKYKIILWSFGYDYSIGFNPDIRLKDKIRLHFYQKADGVIFYWNRGKSEVSKYSKKTEHYFVAPNTVNTDLLVNFKNKFDKIGKENIKKELGVYEKYHFVFVGRLIPDKEVILLLKASNLLKANKEIRISIIGNGPEMKNLMKYKTDNELNNVFFLGEILEQEIVSKWIYISEAFVLPGRLGNSVAQSFSLAVPVISQKKDENFHGEGLGYMKDGINGFLCKDGDEFDLKEKMEKLINEPELKNSLKLNSYNTMLNECSLNKFIEGFTLAINYCLEVK